MRICKPSKLALIVVMVSLFSFSRSVFAKESFGYKITIEAIATHAQISANTQKKALVLTAVPLPPNPDGSLPFIFEGIDLSSLGEGKTNPEILRKLAYSYIHEIQMAYDYIASEKGLFVLGDEFHRKLHSQEPFTDGRSAFTAIYEGWDFTKPRATFGLSYSTLADENLPLAIRAKRPLGDFAHFQPVQLILDTEHGMPDDLGSDFSTFVAGSLTRISRRLRPNVSQEGIQNLFKSELEKLMAGASEQLRSGRLNPANLQEWVNTKLPALKYTLLQMIKATTDIWSLLAFADLAEQNPEVAKEFNFTQKVTNSLNTTLKQFVAQHLAKGEMLLKSGYPAQIRSLTHMKGSAGEDYMLGLFFNAAAKGFFDRVPANLGLPIPDWFIGETSPEHLDSAYRKWEFEVLQTYYDQVFEGKVSVIKLTRGKLANLFKIFLIKPFITEENKKSSPERILDTAIENLATEANYEPFVGRAAVLTMKPEPSFKMRVIEIKNDVPTPVYCGKIL